MTNATATASPIPAPAREQGRGFWRRYWAMWPRTGREILGLLAMAVLAVAGFGLGIGLFAAGLGALPAFLLGVVVLVGALYAARWLGLADLAILEWMGLPAIPRPAWPRRPGFGGWLRSLFGQPHYWLYLLYRVIPEFVVGVVTFVVMTTWIGIALGGTTWAAWGWALRRELPFDGPGGPRYGGLAWALHRWLGGDPLWLEGLVQTAVGLAFLFTLPWITRGLAWLQWWLARGLLAAFRSEALAQELAGAQASRAAAVAAEDSAIRRIERDIHDGPQQRLVRLQMDLASAERRLGDDPAAARELIAAASQQAKEALEELRAVSRGIAPPILLDRGLVAALESAAVRSTVPAIIVAQLPDGLALPPDLERNAYFIASEAMTNAAKHAEARRVTVRVTAEDGSWLVLEIADDGRGGAASTPGHGLAGLADRAQGLGGTLTIESPAGGGTLVTARLPIPVPGPGADPS